MNTTISRIKGSIKKFRRRVNLLTGYGFRSCLAIAPMAVQAPDRFGYRELSGQAFHTIREQRALAVEVIRIRGV